MARTHCWRFREEVTLTCAAHRSLKARAAMAGMSLSDYLLSEIKEIAERPTLAELRDRLHTRKAVTLSLDTARLVREEREAR
jgi:antitoxin FitA